MNRRECLRAGAEPRARVAKHADRGAPQDVVSARRACARGRGGTERTKKGPQVCATLWPRERERN